jgi:tellurite resistance protein
MKPNIAKALLVAKVLVADGTMSDDEKAFFTDIAARLGLDEGERQRAADLEGWDEAEAMIKAWTDDEKREVVALLVDAAGADGRLSPHELAEIKSVELALGLQK